MVENPALVEAGRIIRGETRMLATLAHLEAMHLLVVEAVSIFNGSDDVELPIWLDEARLLTNGKVEA